jgi:hypothetical protein
MSLADGRADAHLCFRFRRRETCEEKGRDCDGDSHRRRIAPPTGAGHALKTVLRREGKT